ncbi:hypothetical protein CKO_01938 [Citrobacter koseri ATCC BAA-895]|uniref:Uncharacterized protein n=1 Tax=Citrobacter koseri (strain ATCC BAA-895 / CDC 4225-83 / SGSC4696) TaxID=290338 RepID=A8AHV2_CITK8|nr:hypothetical protein CKO_01938 [Citrobacter koseri ATCC BAA-895]
MPGGAALTGPTGYASRRPDKALAPPSGVVDVTPPRFLPVAP